MGWPVNSDQLLRIVYQKDFVMSRHAQIKVGMSCVRNLLLALIPAGDPDT